MARHDPEGWWHWSCASAKVDRRRHWVAIKTLGLIYTNTNDHSLPPSSLPCLPPALAKWSRFHFRPSKNNTFLCQNHELNFSMFVEFFFSNKFKKYKTSLKHFWMFNNDQVINRFEKPLYSRRVPFGGEGRGSEFIDFWIKHLLFCFSGIFQANRSKQKTIPMHRRTKLSSRQILPEAMPPLSLPKMYQNGNEDWR